MLEKIIRGTTYISLSSIACQIIALISITLIGRNLGSEEFGKLAVLLSVATLAAAVPSTLFPQSLLWRLNKLERKLEIQTAFSTASLSTLVLAIIFSLLVIPFNKYFFVISLIVITDSIYYLLLNLNLALTEYKYPATINLIRTFVKLLIIIILFFTDFFQPDINFIYIALAYPFSVIFSLLLMEFFQSSNFAKHFKFNLNKSEIYIMLRYGIPLTLSGLIITFSNTMDVLFLEYFHTSEVTGVYYAAKLLIVPLSIFSSSSYGLLISIQSKGDFSQEDIREYTFFHITFSVLVTILVGVLGPYVIILLYGLDYKIDIVITFLISTSGLLISIKRLLSSSILSKGNSNYILISNFVGVSLGIFCCFILIPKYAALGAAFSFLVSTLFSLLLIYIYFRRIGNSNISNSNNNS